MLQAGTRPKKWSTDLSDIALKWRHLTNIIRRSECALWNRIGLFHLDNQFLLSYLIFCSNTFCKKHGPSQKIHPNIWTGLDGLDSTRLVCLDLQFCNIISALEKSPRINKLWQKFSSKKSVMQRVTFMALPSKISYKYLYHSRLGLCV